MKKFILGLLCLGLIFPVESAFAVSRKNYIHMPLKYTYSCRINRERCRVTELTYVGNGRTYYDAVCTGGSSARYFENMAKSDVERKRRQYCEVDL